MRGGAWQRPYPLGGTLTTAEMSEESFAADSFAAELSDSKTRNLAESFEVAGGALVVGFRGR